MKKKIFRRALVFGIMLLFVGISVISSGESVMKYQNSASTKTRPVLCDSFGTSIYVDIKNHEGPWEGTLEHPYRWIWQGIEAANSGDSVFVFWGLYSDGNGERPVYIDKSINLIGEDKYSTEVWMYGWYDYVLNIVADHVNVSGFTFRIAGTTPMNDLMYLGGSNCIISDNNFWGTEIEHDEMALLTMEDAQFNTITGNKIFKPMVNLIKYTKGILLIRSDHNLINENDFMNYDFGISLFDAHENSVIGNTVGTNGTGCPNGINLESSSSNLISENKIDNYVMGLNLIESSHNEITFNRFEGKTIRNRMARFTDCENTWDQNYWNRGRVFPKIIFGSKTINGRSIPAFQFDWHPAQE
jgi:parallel beta-helix repeat protein